MAQKLPEFSTMGQQELVPAHPWPLPASVVLFTVSVGQGQINFLLRAKPKVSKPHPVLQLPTPTSGSPSPPSLHRVQKGENQAVTCPLCARTFFTSLPRRTEEPSRACLWATLIISKNPPFHAEVRLISPQKGQASPVFLFAA